VRNVEHHTSHNNKKTREGAGCRICVHGGIALSQQSGNTTVIKYGSLQQCPEVLIGCPARSHLTRISGLDQFDNNKELIVTNQDHHKGEEKTAAIQHHE